MTYASIDAGTNTIRLLIAEVSGKTIIPRIRLRYITGLGKEIVDTGSFGEKETVSSIRAFKEIAGTMKDLQVHRYFAAGTQAFREAGNSGSFISEIYERTGIQVTVIEPEIEAKLTYDGIMEVIDRKTVHTSVLIDIGGGSSEIISGNPEKGKWASTNLGVVYLHSLFSPHDPPLDWELENMSFFITDRLEAVRRKWRAKRVKTIIGTAGTYTTISAIHKKMKTYDPDKINGTRISRDRLSALARKLYRLPGRERLNMTGMEKGRELLIVPGLIIAEKAMEVFQAVETVVSDGSLLEGTIRAMVTKKLEGDIYELA